MIKKNTYCALFLLVATCATQAFGLFNFYLQANYPQQYFVFPQPVCNVKISCSSYRPSPVHRAPMPIRPAVSYAPAPCMPAYLIDDIDRALANLANYTIPDFCNQQPIIYQQTCWYALRNIRELVYQISHNWYSFIDEYGTYIHCPCNAAASFTTNQNFYLNAILNNLARINNTVNLPHCTYPATGHFQAITTYINQDLRTIVAITDAYSGSYRNLHALEDIAFYLERIAKNFESLSYCY